ncbi:MAG: hypothetical protein ACI9DJ_002234, partial [Algoriphagus sp.]
NPAAVSIAFINIYDSSDMCKYKKRPSCKFEMVSFI